MKCLVVIAHPLENSLCASLAKTVIATLLEEKHDVVVRDLYQAQFQPTLTADERQHYYRDAYPTTQIAEEASELQAAEILVLVFPTWWFGMPAILKGWFDRVWAPGMAYDHAKDFGPIKPRLTNLRYTLAVTTLGSEWWVDRLILWQPVRRVLKSAILGMCAPQSKLKFISLYKVEQLPPDRLTHAESRIRKAIRRLSA